VCPNANKIEQKQLLGHGLGWKGALAATKTAARGSAYLKNAAFLSQLEVIG
jgi:hypothetical protein